MCPVQLRLPMTLLPYEKGHILLIRSTVCLIKYGKELYVCRIKRYILPVGNYTLNKMFISCRIYILIRTTLVMKTKYYHWNKNSKCVSTFFTKMQTRIVSCTSWYDMWVQLPSSIKYVSTLFTFVICKWRKEDTFTNKS
jgi:hypothetical protein